MRSRNARWNARLRTNRMRPFPQVNGVHPAAEGGGTQIRRRDTPKTVPACVRAHESVSLRSLRSISEDLEIVAGQSTFRGGTQRGTQPVRNVPPFPLRHSEPR